MLEGNLDFVDPSQSFFLGSSEVASAHGPPSYLEMGRGESVGAWSCAREPRTRSYQARRRFSMASGFCRTSRTATMTTRKGSTA